MPVTIPLIWKPFGKVYSLIPMAGELFSVLLLWNLWNKEDKFSWKITVYHLTKYITFCWILWPQIL